MVDLTAVEARYARALDAKPSKGEYTPDGIAALTDSVADVAVLLAEVERLSRWKAEALGVIRGLQDLGKALGLPPGVQITGEAAAAKARSLAAEVERLWESERAFAEALGYGDGKTEPAAALRDLVDPLGEALAVAMDHGGCPVVCEMCGERLAATVCPQCSGSGCLPNEALAAMECDTCAGVGRIHEGCAEMSYADLVAERDALAARVARVEALLTGHYGADEFGTFKRHLHEELRAATAKALRGDGDE